MGIINKEEVLYVSTGIDLTGLREGRQEVLEILQALVQEASAMDVFGGISMAAAAAFTQTASGLYSLSHEFDEIMADMAVRFPELNTQLETVQHEILVLTTQLPVGAVECARALNEIVGSGLQGEQAMEQLREAARLAVVEVVDVVEALGQIGGDVLTGNVDIQLEGALGATEAQLQLLQNRMLVMLRPLGDQLMQQVSRMATELGQTLSGGNISGNLNELDTLISLATAALRDYKLALEDGTAAVTSETTALEMAVGVRDAYLQVLETGLGLREEEISQQGDYYASLEESMALEEEMNGAKLAFAQQAIGVAQQLSSIVADEIVRVREKKEAYSEDLQVREAILQAAEEELTQAGELREVRQKEYDTLKWGNDEAATTLATTRLQEAAEQEVAAAVKVDSASREVRNAQLKLETVNRQTATASVVANTVATGTSVVTDKLATTSTFLLARAKQAATVATRSLTAALAANPLGMVLTVVSLAITAFSAFGKETGKSADEQERLNETLQKQMSDLRSLNTTLFDKNGDDMARAEALLKLKELLPQVYGKVELANLAEQDRNQLLKEGNRELNRRRELELQAQKAASLQKIEEFKKPQVRVNTNGGLSSTGISAIPVKNDPRLAEELEHYQKIETELKRIQKLKIMTAGLGVSDEQRLIRYKTDLKDMRGRLQEVNAQLQLMYGNQVAQMSFDPEMFSGKGRELFEEKQNLEQRISDTNGYVQKLDKGDVVDNTLMHKRKQMEEQLTDMVEKMMLQRQKNEILLGKQGLAQKLALIDFEYDLKEKEILQKEKEVKALYGKDKVPKEAEESIKQLKENNQKERENEKARAESQNDAEVKKHIEEQRKAFLLAETEKLQALDRRYQQELDWAKQHKEQFKNEDEYVDYTSKLKSKHESDKWSLLFPNDRDFDAEEATVRQKWQEKRDNVGENANLRKQLDRAETKEISKLHADEIISSDDWVSLFSELDDLTVSEIDKLITSIESKMSTADLQPIDRKALIGNLNKAKEQVITLNPFRALGNSFQSVFVKGSSASKKSTGEVRDNWKQLGKSTKGCFDFINDAVSNCDVLGDILGESGRASIAMVQGIASAGIAMATSVKGAEKGSVILTVISAALQVVTALFSTFNKDKKKEARIQRLQVNVEQLERAYDKLGNTIDRTYSDKVFGLMDQQNDNLRQQQEMIGQQIEAEKSKKKTDDSKIREWENKLEDIDEQIEENQRKRIEMLAGTDVKSAIDEFADALVEAYAKGEDGATALADTTKKVMANAVKEALKRKFLGDQIEEAVTFLGDSMSDGALSGNEKNRFQSMVEAAGKNFSEALKVYDELFSGENELGEGGVSGQLQEAVTEGTANQLVGLWNMTANDIRSMRNLTAEQLTLCSMMNLNVGEILRQQYQIEANTRRMAENATQTVVELQGGFSRVEGRLKAIDENTRGYTGRGK